MLRLFPYFLVFQLLYSCEEITQPLKIENKITTSNTAIPTPETPGQGELLEISKADTDQFIKTLNVIALDSDHSEKTLCGIATLAKKIETMMEGAEGEKKYESLLKCLGDLKKIQLVENSLPAPQMVDAARHPATHLTSVVCTEESLKLYEKEKKILADFIKAYDKGNGEVNCIESNQ
jgi:hypothetical protein